MDQRMEKLLQGVKDTACYAAGKAAEAAAATGQAVSAAWSGRSRPSGRR